MKGIITTYSPDEYQKFVNGREEIMALAKRCRLKNLTKLFVGTNKKLTQPENNSIEETIPLDIDGSHFIVEIAKKSSFSKPLVIISGGQLTSIANAYLLDTSIAGKILVMGIFGANKITCNAALDAWAWTIILAKFRVVAITDYDEMVFNKPPVILKERIRKELNQDIPLFKWMYEKKNIRPTGGPTKRIMMGIPPL